MQQITSARFGDAAASVIEVEADGRYLFVPAQPGNRHYDALIAAGYPIEDYQPPAISPDEVRAEASRRMQALFGARDAAHLALIIENGTREAVRLLRLKDQGEWTPEETLRSAQLAGADAMIEAIRAASNALEAMAPVPADYADDKYWPGGGGE